MARSAPSVREGQILRSFGRPRGILFVAAEAAQEEAGDAHEDSRVSQSTSKAGDAFGGVGGPEARRSPRRRVR
eukprot:14913867-Alexandrium_andersonii.AAC.1